MSSGSPHEIVILDFDGTIVNSMPFLTKVAVRLLIDRYGLDKDEARRAYVRTCGLPFVKQLETLMPQDSRNAETVRLFERAKSQHLLEFNLFPDVKPAIEVMRSSGLRVCVSSGNREHLIRRLLKRRGLEVDLVMGYDDGFMKGLAHFEFARRHFKSSFERMVFIGDSWHDAKTAKEAGIGFIARIGLLSREELEELLPGIPIVASLLEALVLMGIEAPEEKKLKSS